VNAQRKKEKQWKQGYVSPLLVRQERDWQKVVSLLREDDTIIICIPDTSNSIRVEHLPCVATFDSYKNTDGNQVCYLLKVEYHGVDGKQQRGSSLVPFFDDDDIEQVGDNSNLTTFPEVSAIAIGCGIDSEQHVAMI